MDLNVHMARLLTIAAFWLVELDFPDDGGGLCYRNMLECSLTV